MVFVNGLPLAVLELKNPGGENAIVRGAFNQLQTYKRDIPCLFPYNALLVASDGLEARMGTLSSDWERFSPWRTVDGNEIAPRGTPELETLVRGIFDIEHLISLAKDMRHAQKRGEDLKLSEEELAFYDALEVNDGAVKVLGDETLRGIARELVEIVRNNTTIDWSVKENVRAKLRTLVKRLLRKYGYPPDKQEAATETVLKQAELLCKEEAA